MNTVGIIIGIVLVVGYVAAAVYAISSCETKGGASACSGVAIGVGVLISMFIEYIVAICLIGIVIAIIGAVSD